MTLLEKFHQWLKTEPFNSKERPTLREAQCVFIAEEFAIGFAEWVRKETYYEHLTKEFFQFQLWFDLC
jgi:hypothetical protein